jgi:hypothetical protein
METIGLMWTITMYNGLASSIVMLVFHSLNKLAREHDKMLYPPMNGTFWTSHLLAKKICAKFHIYMSLFFLGIVTRFVLDAFQFVTF